MYTIKFDHIITASGFPLPTIPVFLQLISLPTSQSFFVCVFCFVLFVAH